MRKFALLVGLMLPFFISSGATASSFSGTTGGTSLTTKSSRHPNMIFIMLDDIGREQYPQLNAPWADDGTSATFSNTEHGTRFPVPTASDFPNLTKLLDNGINFEGMWAGTQCRGGRNILRSGTFAGLEASYDEDLTPKRQVQDNTGEAYGIYHYGKPIMGCLRSGTPTCTSGVGGPQNDFRTGLATNGPGSWWAGSWQTYTNDSDTAVMETVPQDTELMEVTTSSGDFIMQNQDEFGIEQGMEFVEDLYGGGTLPQSWWAHQTGPPFMVTLGLHAGHGAAGYECWHTRTATNDRIIPTADQMTEYQTGGTGGVNPTNSAAGGASTAPLGPSTPSYNASTYTDLVADDSRGGVSGAPAGVDWWKVWFDCQMSGLKYVDEQVGKIIDWLGPEGLKHTMIVFVGDNGTVADQIPNRTGLCPPATSEGAPLDDVVDDTASPTTSCITQAGKGSNSETGLNVPFVVAYGPVADQMRGTSSKARLSFADWSETTVQLAQPKSTGSGYYSDGRDFSGILKGSVADPDRPGGEFGVTVSMMAGTDSYAAVAQPDASGNIYRLWRRYDGTANMCDYVQDLSRSDYETNLRTSSDSEVTAAITALGGAVNTAYSVTEGGSNCGP